MLYANSENVFDLRTAGNCYTVTVLQFPKGLSHSLKILLYLYIYLYIYKYRVNSDPYTAYF